MTLIEQIIQKYLEDREKIKEMRKRHAEELRVLEEYQSAREAALLERAGIEAFEFFVDIFLNGRDGKAEAEKKKVSIGLDQAKIEAWLLKMLRGVGKGIQTTAGTVYLTRKESVSVSDFDTFVSQNMVKSAAEKVLEHFEVEIVDNPIGVPDLLNTIIQIIHDNMHLELLNKAINKTAVLELMGEADVKTGARPNPPPLGSQYIAIQTVGVRKATK